MYFTDHQSQSLCVYVCVCVCDGSRRTGVCVCGTTVYGKPTFGPLPVSTDTIYSSINRSHSHICPGHLLLRHATHKTGKF